MRSEQAAFGQRLRELRTERGTSQEALAFRAGIDRTVVSRLEHGACDPRLRSILGVARALGVKPGELLDHI
jgi:XRE family transcriptional regulator, regulator of sulfur utilization